jgi:hypothetical protein
MSNETRLSTRAQYAIKLSFNEAMQLEVLEINSFFAQFHDSVGSLLVQHREIASDGSGRD